MAEKCPALRADGEPCGSFVMPTGYCKKHDPSSRAKAEIQRLKEEDLGYLQLKERQIKRSQERLQELKDEIDANKEDRLADLLAAVAVIDDAESLRQAELEIIKGLITEKIDAKAGGPIVAALKHQAELLGFTKKENVEKRDPHKRELMIKLSGELNESEVFELVSNFGAGLKRLEKKADDLGEGEILTIPFKEVQPVKVDDEPESGDLF